MRLVIDAASGAEFAAAVALTGLLRGRGIDAFPVVDAHRWGLPGVAGLAEAAGLANCPGGLERLGGEPGGPASRLARFWTGAAARGGLAEIYVEQGGLEAAAALYGWLTGAPVTVFQEFAELGSLLDPAAEPAVILVAPPATLTHENIARMFSWTGEAGRDPFLLRAYPRRAWGVLTGAGLAGLTYTLYKSYYRRDSEGLPGLVLAGCRPSPRSGRPGPEPSPGGGDPSQLCGDGEWDYVFLGGRSREDRMLLGQTMLCGRRSSHAAPPGDAGPHPTPACDGGPECAPGRLALASRLRARVVAANGCLVGHVSPSRIEYDERFSLALAVLESPAAAYVASHRTKHECDAEAWLFARLWEAGVPLGETTLRLNQFLVASGVDAAAYVLYGDPRLSTGTRRTLEVPVAWAPAAEGGYQGELEAPAGLAAVPLPAEGTRRGERFAVCLSGARAGGPPVFFFEAPGRSPATGGAATLDAGSGWDAASALYVFSPDDGALAGLGVELRPAAALAAGVRLLDRFGAAFGALAAQGLLPPSLAGSYRDIQGYGAHLATWLATAGFDAAAGSRLWRAVAEVGRRAGAFERECLRQWLARCREDSVRFTYRYLPASRIVEELPSASACPYCGSELWRQEVAHLVRADIRREWLFCPTCGVIADAPPDGLTLSIDRSDAVSGRTSRLACAIGNGGPEPASGWWGATVRGQAGMGVAIERPFLVPPGGAQSLEAGVDWPADVRPDRYYYSVFLVWDRGIQFHKVPLVLRQAPPGGRGRTEPGPGRACGSGG